MRDFTESELAHLREIRRMHIEMASKIAFDKGVVLHPRIAEKRVKAAKLKRVKKTNKKAKNEIKP